MEISIYENKLPDINEHVIVIFTEYKDTHIEANLIEYNSINGMMIYEDATRKKKVYDWKKEIPLNKVIVARVEEIFYGHENTLLSGTNVHENTLLSGTNVHENTYVKLSTGYFDQKMDSSELRKKLMKPFVDNKALITIIKKICRNNDLNFNDFWSIIMYKIINEKKKEDLNGSILDYVSENKDFFKNTIKENYPDHYEKIINQYEKQLLNKNYKIQSKFSLITKHSIENTKELLKLSCDNNKDWIFTLKYETTPIFLLESSSENSTQENHDVFLQFLENNSKVFNVNYVKIN